MAVPYQADHRRADRGGDVVVARRHVGRERPQRVERRLVADLELVQVLFDQVHRHVAGTLNHHLDVVVPGDRRELAEGVELGD
jgi:hypothetical protein